MDSTKVELINFTFNKESGNLDFSLNLWILGAILLVVLLICVIVKLYRKKQAVEKTVEPVKLKFKLAGVEVEYNIVRNFQNIEIAHKIYIELVTRKAAIEIEEDRDVIVEIYNSWYSIFQSTRNELKSIKGELLKENEASQELIRLLTDILNRALRPHLTEYQARFRKWYGEQLGSNENVSPQDIQKQYDDIEPLMESMKEVNSTLIDYSEQLKLFIYG
jgi:hypothetical protein